MKKTAGLFFRNLVFLALLVLVVLTGAYFRFVGIDWGENSFMHPDERFLLMVGSALEPVDSISEYFDTTASTLNPHNRGYGFYVYGTLPMFLTRYVVQWQFGHSGLIEMLEVGRPLSALFDLMTVLLVAAIALTLYGRAAALISAAFAAFTVLHIQQSHYFTMDTFITFFTVLAIYFAIRVGTERKRWKDLDSQGEAVAQSKEDLSEQSQAQVETQPERPFEVSDVTHAFAPAAIRSAGIIESLRKFILHPFFFLSVGFGTALGMAVASKLNAAPVAMLLPVGILIYFVSLPLHERERRYIFLLSYLVLAAFVSLVIFRIFQPYAFSGPGFFGILPNQEWVANITEQRVQAAGDVDFPPAMQWARRPIWFSFQNMVLWGMGLPYGLLAWSAFLWMGWRILKGEWRPHLILWGWTAFYFIWQSLQFNPTMRYQLPIYPTLAVIAGWALVRLWNSRTSIFNGKVVAAVVGVTALSLTFAWAYAFSEIYTRPFTRVEASRWIYQNIPGPINLEIEGSEGIFNQILPFPYSYTISPGHPYLSGFEAKTSGVLKEITLPNVFDLQTSSVPTRISLLISVLPYGEEPLAVGEIEANADGTYTFYLNQPVYLSEATTYYLTLNLADGENLLNVCSDLVLHIQMPGMVVDKALPGPDPCILHGDEPYSTSFTVQTPGVLNMISAAQVQNVRHEAGPKTLMISLYQSGTLEPLASTSWTGVFDSQAGQRQNGHRLIFDQPVSLRQGERYDLALELTEGDGALILQGTPIANEGDWDDGLPLRIDGYDGYGGIYPPGLNFNMYTDDNPDKLERFLRVLDESEYLLISSNRQWGSLPRIPERYPLVTTYYRHLLGCPEELSIQWCYNVAERGMFQGYLGFELIQIFQSSPNLGPLQINTQFAEEAFTVYDHPKVFVFKKAEGYDPEQVSSILNKVDFSKVIRLTPKKAPSHPADLMLPSSVLTLQREGGTWSELFDVNAPQNRFQALGVLVWYLALGLLGVAAYPWVRLALPGLPDRGYPFARIAGLILLAFLVWSAGSLGMPVTHFTITLAFLVIALSGILFTFVQYRELILELRQRYRYFLIIEGLFLAFFISGLLLRLGNPDLWHQYFGGEKPMDFAYFNAVLKSTTFPPYDPWFAGGYLNYYYYGFVLVGMFTKWLGIVPAFAYNLFLPTMFTMIAMGAFSGAWNLYQRSALRSSKSQVSEEDVQVSEAPQSRISLSEVPGISQPSPLDSHISPYLVGFLGALFMAVLGNLGTVRMIFQGYQRLAAPGGVIEDADIFTRLFWAAQGVFRALSGAQMPFRISDWYWLPSRVIPAQGDIEPITEFPFFTVLYGDPHAHLFALPVALLALAFSLSIVMSRLRWQNWPGAVAGFAMGGLTIGALYPINLSDIYTYLPLGLVALFYAGWRYLDVERVDWLPMFPAYIRKIIASTALVLFLVALAFLFYQPYRAWYGQGYGSILPWEGPRTPSFSYITHWGLFLFVFISWLAWETREWMAATPLSALRKLAPYKAVIQSLLVLFVAISAAVVITGVHIGWLVLPLAAWAGLLLLRPGISDARRMVLFLIGTGLAITLMVEIVVVRGDIGRMNTVFKFYLQAWTLFAVAAAAAVGWLINALPGWKPSWRSIWQVCFALLVASTALFTLLGTTARVRDRMVQGVPLTLDGMAYMAYATYNNLGTEMDLNQDYNAILWMQENVSGSPVIVEATSPNQYAWFSRYSIYTGLPAVRGWEWHQIQQRVLAPTNQVVERGYDVANFYQTIDPEAARQFLEQYEVAFIIVGQVERGYYPGQGLDKFSEYDGMLWQSVYQDRDTVIYEVIR